MIKWATYPIVLCLAFVLTWVLDRRDCRKSWASTVFIIGAFILSLMVLGLGKFAIPIILGAYVALCLRVVGLTGGIACGKSTVAKRLQSKNVVLIDSDVIAKEIVQPGQPAYKKIVARFGKEILHENGSLNREKLGSLVFADPKARKLLNSITHPAIMYTILKRILYYTSHLRKDVVLDAPLLYESGVLQYLCYPIIVVSCQKEQQIKRMYDRNGLTTDEGMSRIQAQMPLSEKVSKADIVIENDSSLQALERKVDEKWDVAMMMLGVKGSGQERTNKAM